LRLLAWTREDVPQAKGGHAAERVEIREFGSKGRAITVDIRELCWYTGKPCVVIQENNKDKEYRFGYNCVISMYHIGEKHLYKIGVSMKMKTTRAGRH
jgi:hypothetical protein